MIDTEFFDQIYNECSADNSSAVLNLLISKQEERMVHHPNFHPCGCLIQTGFEWAFLKISSKILHMEIGRCWDTITFDSDMNMESMLINNFTYVYYILTSVLIINVYIIRIIGRLSISAKMIARNWIHDKGKISSVQRRYRTYHFKETLVFF